MTAPTPDYATTESAPRLEPPPPPVLAPPTTATPPPPEMPSMRSAPQLPPIGDLLVMLGAVMILGFSFAPFVSYTDSSAMAVQGGVVHRSAWEWSAYLAPLTWFIMLGGLFLLALGLSHALSGDRKLLTFKVSQLQLVVAAYTTSLLLGYAMTQKSLSVNVFLLGTQIRVGSGEYAWGGVLMLVGSLVALVGAVFNLLRQPAFGYFGPVRRT